MRLYRVALDGWERVGYYLEGGGGWENLLGVSGWVGGSKGVWR